MSNKILIAAVAAIVLASTGLASAQTRTTCPSSGSQTSDPAASVYTTTKVRQQSSCYLFMHEYSSHLWLKTSLIIHVWLRRNIYRAQTWARGLPTL